MKISLRRTGATLVLLGSTLGVLTGCFPLAVGGAVMTGMVATDRRTAGTVVEDEGIELRAASRIRENLGERAHVNVTSYNRQVVLTGEVPSAQDKQLVEQIVAGVDNVRHIVDEIGVMGNSSLQRSSDALVTGRVKAGLIDAKDLFTNAFKITTERGTVYVMGRVTEREAKRATDVISATPGVQKVVRILEIVSEEELARLVPPTRPDAPKQ
ncbi:BON domain-containing protein [Rhodoferax sp. AJA081-3]|uniref:BON domain-containing protein n=1 Tax=Rhodoferax sp. AJA081-3 TaxID=2752316 RepID=UPI001AE0D738|nr:BON domain-containing protein [Rhodoferax sp. AJA081-3]QTN30411.1 BON domain-containing protein [Rhodoferax sp. AJA081-3]